MADENMQEGNKQGENTEPNQQGAKGAPDDAQKMKRLQSELAEVKAQLEEERKNREDLNSQLEKALTEDDVAKAVKDVKEEAEKALTEATAKATAREKKLVVENELIKANCIDTVSALAHVDLDNVEIASDGHISGLDVASLAESHKHLFEQPNTAKVSSAGTPGGNGKQMTKEEIMQIKDASERRKAIAENLDLFERKA